MVIYRYSTIGNGYDYASPQAWEEATSGLNLVSRDEIQIGVLKTNQDWSDLYISNPDPSYVDDQHYRALITEGSGFFNYRTKRGAQFSLISGGQDYFRIGPGVGVVKYNSPGTAIDLSGRRLILNGISVVNGGSGSYGIRLIDNSGESFVANTLVFGNYNNGTGYYTNNSGSYLLNCTFYSTGNSVGSAGFSAVNTASFSTIPNSAKIETNYQAYCASTYSGTSGSYYSGVDPYDVFINTYKSSEDFSPLDINGFLSISGYSFNDIFYYSGWQEFLPSTFSGLASIYEDTSEIESILSQDLLSNRRNTHYAIGAIEKQSVISISPDDFRKSIKWYQSEYNPNSISGKVGGSINLNKSITNGYIDVFPTVPSYRNNWNAISDDEKLPYLYVKTGEGIETAYLRRIDNDDIILLRGWNYVNNVTGEPYLGSQVLINDVLTSDSYSYDAIEVNFRLLRKYGYNSVRLLLDTGGFGYSGHLGYDIFYTGLYPVYLDRLAAFISGAAENKLYTILYTEYVPFNTKYYIDLIQPSSLSINAQIGAANQQHLFTGYMNSKKQYLYDLSSELVDRLGDDSKYVLWCITSEPFLVNTQPPFRRIDQTGGLIVTDGVYPNPNHVSGWWDMSVPSEVTEMTVRTTNYIYNEYISSIKSVIPDALVGATSLPWTARYKSNSTGWEDVQDIFESKDHPLTMRHFTEANFDLVGANIYPNIYLRNIGNKLYFNLPYRSFSEALYGSEYDEIDRSRFATWIGEYGYWATGESGTSSQDTMPAWSDDYLEYIKKSNLVTSSVFDNYSYFHLSGANYSLFGGEPNRFYGLYDSISGSLLYATAPNTYHNYNYIDNTGSYCYRKVFIRNEGDTLYQPRIYLSDEEYVGNVAIALEIVSGDYAHDSFRIPLSISIDSFVAPHNYSDGLSVSTLSSGDSVGLWIRVDAEGYTEDPYVGFNIKIEGTYNV